MTQTLYAEDQSGSRHKVVQRVEPPHDDSHASDHGASRLV